MGRPGNELVLEPDELLQLGILLEPARQAGVADKVLRPLARVHKVLAVVVVGIEGLGALEEGRGVPVLLLLLLLRWASCAVAALFEFVWML